MDGLVIGFLAIALVVTLVRLMWFIAYREGYRQGEAYGRGAGAQYVRSKLALDEENRARHGGL